MAVYVVGSINVDLILLVKELPAAGATILSGDPIRTGGGKGANVAVAAARYGADVHLVAAVGDDADGRDSLEQMTVEGVAIDGVTVLRGPPTGLAVICVAADAENFVVVAPGANGSLTPQLLAPPLQRLTATDVCTLNFEIPREAVRAAAVAAQERDARILINASPVRPLDDDLLTGRTCLVMNAGELADLTGQREVRAGVAALLARDCGEVVVTLGSQGALVVDAAGNETHVEAFAAAAVDTTGAGDTFTGVVAAARHEGAELVEAARSGAAAAALSTERVGARTAMPSRQAVQQRITRGTR